MGVKFDRRIDVDMGSTEAKQAVAAAAARSGQSEAGFVRALLLAAIGAREPDKGMRLPRDRRGFRAAARMLQCAGIVRDLLQSAQDAEPDPQVRRALQRALDEVTRALAELQ